MRTRLDRLRGYGYDLLLMTTDRTVLANAVSTAPAFPRTRYQGSKRRFARRIVEHLSSLEFDTVLDAFGGTGSVAHEFKRVGKRVTYNDILAFNHQIGVALIENDGVRLESNEIATIGQRRSDLTYGDTIARNFGDVYFTDDENQWLDVAVANIARMEGRFRRALARHAVFQAAMAKRPYNLFHRANLYMRTADVARGFGNKASWDRGFEEHIATFAKAANSALIDGRGGCRALCADALNLEPNYDLVYIDPPYISHAGVGVDYRDFYHFLEGMMDYKGWPDRIDRSSKHRRLHRQPDPWSNPRTNRDQFLELFEHYRNSILVLSYRNDGIPTIPELESMLKRIGHHTSIVELDRNQYVLSKRRKTREMLLIGAPRHR